MKRLFDFFAALGALILLLPLLLLIALAVVFDSGWPPFFIQQRVGRRGRLFGICKFRSMAVLKEAAKGRFDAGDARRVTRVGRFLRRTKLDELPQLWNVVRGDMALVGPRPEVPAWVQVYPERWQKVLELRPGITDNAALEFRHEEKLLAAAPEPERCYREQILPRKLELYEHYLRTRSFGGDIQLLIKTICYL